MKNVSLLSKKDIDQCLKKHSEWSVNAKQTQFQATFSFANHVTALVMIARITVHAEVQQHHPDIQYTYKKLKIKVATHECKGLTKKDTKLIEKIDELIGDRA